MPPTSAIEFTGQLSVLAPGVILQDRYRIIRQLGKGGMGAVYEAVDQRLDATVALKETFSLDDRLRRQFEHEARLLAQLNHPALPKVSDYFTEGDRAFLVMQFISGVDLAEIIAKQPGPFPRNQVIAWADQLLDALVYLHTRDRQVIHRDIKPHNLKLTSTGQIALLDFGLAKAQLADLSAAHSSDSICGYTRRYAPLEQIQDQGTTPQSDIYALGATLYHLLAGVKPADALQRAAALVNSKPDPLKPANEIHAAVGPEIAAILCRAMAQNPGDRFSSASDFREALGRVGREAGLAESRAQPSAKPASAASDHKAIVRTDVRPSDPFDSYSILKPDETAWLLPKDSRGPNTIAGILLMVITAGIVSFYGYHHWIEPSNPGFSSKVAADLRSAGPTVHPNKPDRARYNESGIAAGSFASGDAKRKDTRRQNEKQDRSSFRMDSANLNAPTMTPLLPRERLVESVRKMNLPNPRLPNAEVKANDPAPSIQRLPVYAQPDLGLERHIQGAPNGTQRMKLSEGATRAFRLGEKTVQPTIAPK